MSRIFVPLFISCATHAIASLDASRVTINWTLVGNFGNAADPATGSLFRALANPYNIDKSGAAQLEMPPQL
jgi:hypothetical protein